MAPALLAGLLLPCCWVSLLSLFSLMLLFFFFFVLPV
jgi:hypothetical protein